MTGLKSNQIYHSDEPLRPLLPYGINSAEEYDKPIDGNLFEIIKIVDKPRADIVYREYHIKMPNGKQYSIEHEQLERLVQQNKMREATEDEQAKFMLGDPNTDFA
jgi:hypothetical protein